MAAPVKQRPGRMLGAVAILLVALYLGVFLGPSATPSLGLDLRGGTQVTLTAHPICHGTVTKSALNQAVNIIRARSNGLGANGAEVNTQGSSNIVVSVPGQGHDAVVKKIGQTALLRFRQAEAIVAGAPAPKVTPSVSPTPTGKAGKGAKGAKNGKGQPKASTSPTPTTSATSKKKNGGSSGLALSQALLKKHPNAKTTPTAKSTAPAKGKKGKSTQTATPTPTPTPTPTSVTPAAPTAGCVATASTDTPLPGSESRTLTPAFEKSFNNWDCTNKATANPTNGADDPADYVIACDTTGSVKYLLAPAAVEGTDVTSADANLDSTTNSWVVDLKFNGSGGDAWQKVTEQAYNVNQGQAENSGCPLSSTGCNSVAITLDGLVQSAPYISQAGGIAGGSAEISGTFTQSSATSLANILKYGALPLNFTQSDVESVSATLGAAQLRGGLIAGVIGLGLVILFSLLYYRALGLVTVGSLMVSGLILYAVTTLLGHSSVGYTLSLPGIAGFIVAVGITADSFVVFFERLRDEIREGRRLRSGVERAWPRARRTILSADTVSLLAAAVLYVVSIGDVRGFAFTLGLSTISDLFIVFFFTRPLLQLLAKVKAFDTGKGWTGVGKARAGIVPDVAPERGTRTPRSRSKED